MNKHILSYTDKLNESIGRGSILLIKGRPMKDGRFLYVTTIKGYVEIKPGIKMVFIGDTIYRVVHKGGDKFSGKKVDYRGEDGLKGVFNMKNPGKPSVVLNHNKTPFHWITLGHTDIGKAIREVGPRLFNHELILESYDKSADDNAEAKNFLLREVTKLITGQETILKLVNVDTNEGGEELTDVEDDEGSISSYETELELMLTADREQIPPEHVDYLEDNGMFPLDLGFDGLSDDDFELLGLDKKVRNAGIIVAIRYTTDAQVRHSHDPGDHWTPPSGDSEVDDVETSLADDPFTIEGDYATEPDDLDYDLEVYNRMIEEDDPSELVHSISELVHGYKKKIGGVDRDVTLTRQLRSLFYNYSKALVDLKKNGLDEEAKKRWSKVDTLNIAKIESQSNEIIEKHKELEAIARDVNQELTQEQIDSSKVYFDMIRNLVPAGKTSFKYGKSYGDKTKIDMMNDSAIKSAVNSLKWSLKNPDSKKLSLERELMAINYQKARYNVLKKEYPKSIHQRDEKLDFYLNHRK
jgi:hypothetical protein